MDPSEPELRISARLVLHVAAQPPSPSAEVASNSLTQAGMAATLSTSQAAVSHAVRRLVDGGIFWAERRHVRDRRQRVTVYQLTADGEALAKYIRARLRQNADGPRTV